MRYFDLGEHTITPHKSILAEIPKLGAEWKVIFEFNPENFLRPSAFLVAIWIKLANKEVYSLTFSPNGVQLRYEFPDELDGDIVVDVGESAVGLPAIANWTKIEITCAVYEETGKYAISVAIAGIEVIKVPAWSQEPEQMDATIGLGDEQNTLSGAIREALTKKKMFSFGHCPKRGGRPLPEFFGPFFTMY